MTSIEETGKDIEEATQRALEQLGVTEDEVDVEIMEEGLKGFLGLGQAPARVRVTVKKAPSARSRRGKAAAEPETKPKRQPKPKAEPAESVPAPVVEQGTAVLDDAVQQVAETGRETLQNILDGICDGAKAVVRNASNGEVVLDMVGGDTAILIGKHGQTINALQYLVGVIANRRLADRVRIIIDAEGYRGRREEALRKQALFLAKKVKESGQEAVLEELQPNERRIVHMTLADDTEVYTYSEGEDPARHVVISPKK